MSSAQGDRAGGSGTFDHVVAGAHADYHREIQQHTEPDGLVEDVVTYRVLAPHLMRTLLFLVVPTVLGIVKLLIDYLASMSSPDDVTDVLSAVLGIVIVVLYLAGIAAFFAPAKEPIAEYSRLLEGRAPAAESAYDWVRHAAATRQSPAEVEPGTVGGVPVLLFRQHNERAMLLVQPYGRDLYVGWTMWRSRSSATLLVHFLRDTFGRFAPAPRFSAELRAAGTRALRESIHSLSREGVTAAVHATGAPPSSETGVPAGSWTAAPPSPSAQQQARPDQQWSEQPRSDQQRADQQRADQPRPEPVAGPTSGALPTAGAHGPHPYTGWQTEERRPREEVSARREGTARREQDWGPPPRRPLVSSTEIR